MTRFAFVVLILFGGIAAVAVAGCSDDPPAKKVDSAAPDQAGGQADFAPLPDQSRPDVMWPDLKADTAKPPIDYSVPGDYGGTPFGCQTNADCFGQKCCATPWGVKLCASACN